jgi:hypothetical protein
MEQKTDESVVINSDWWLVSPLQAYFLSIITLNIFVAFWVGINWSKYKKTTGEKIRPFWRGWFYILYIDPLFKRMLTFTNSRGQTTKFSHSTLALFFILFSIGSDIIAKLPNLYGEVGALLFWFLSPLPIYYVQKNINQASTLTASEHKIMRISGVDILLIVVLTVLMLLMLCGILIKFLT